MSCTDCFNGCGTPTPDTCVKYTGPNIPLLGIETGDPLSKVEEEIIDKLEEFATGAGITLSDIDLKCDFLKDTLGCCKDKTLVNLIQMLIDANCTLKELIDSCCAAADPAFVYNLKCITGVPDNPSRDDILQAVINKVCAMDVTLNTIYGDYVKASQLNSLIAAYLASVSTSVQQYTKMVPFVAYEYYGNINVNFSGSVGNPGMGFDKVHLCVGQTVNGFTLPDKRGRVAVGVPSMPGGPALPAAVNYALPQNAGTNYVLKQQFGSYFHLLTSNEMPSHTHVLSDPGHGHSLQSGYYAGSDGRGNSIASSGSDVFNWTSGKLGINVVATNTTGITISSAGGSIQHENRQPSVAAYYIMYIP